MDASDCGLKGEIGDGNLAAHTGEEGCCSMLSAIGRVSAVEEGSGRSEENGDWEAVEPGTLKRALRELTSLQRLDMSCLMLPSSLAKSSIVRAAGGVCGGGSVDGWADSLKAWSSLAIAVLLAIFSIFFSLEPC